MELNEALQGYLRRPPVTCNIVSTTFEALLHSGTEMGGGRGGGGDSGMKFYFATEQKEAERTNPG